MESYQQSNKRAIVYARMQLHVSFGKAVYLVGNSEETGKWDVSKAYRLTWTSVRGIPSLGRYLARILHHSCRNPP